MVSRRGGVGFLNLSLISGQGVERSSRRTANRLRQRLRSRRRTAIAIAMAAVMLLVSDSIWLLFLALSGHIRDLVDGGKMLYCKVSRSTTGLKTFE